MREVGQPMPGGRTDDVAAQKAVEHKLLLRSTLEKALLRSPAERANSRSNHPYGKFRVGEVIIRSLSNDTYPEIDNSRGISNWFKLELFDFYHNGLEFILDIRQAALDKKGNWRLLERSEQFSEDTNWQSVKVWEIGRIPYRNIRAYDLKGDEYYNFPHLYCAFADNGEPYEEVRYALVGEGTNYDCPLDSGKRLV